MSKHHSQRRQKKTKKLMQRALDQMVVSGEDNFSYKSVMQKMKELSTEEEKILKILIGTPSTISHNSEYQAIIRQAKIQAFEKQSVAAGCDSFPEMSEHELKTKVDLLIRRNAMLSDEVSYKDKLLRKVDSFQLDEVNGQKENTLILPNESKYKNLFKELVWMLYDSRAAYLSREKNGAGSTLWLSLIGGSKKILSKEGLEELGFELGEDGKSMTLRMGGYEIE